MGFIGTSRRGGLQLHILGKRDRESPAVDGRSRIWPFLSWGQRDRRGSLGTPLATAWPGEASWAETLNISELCHSH